MVLSTPNPSTPSAVTTYLEKDGHERIASSHEQVLKTAKSVVDLEDGKTAVTGRKERLRNLVAFWLLGLFNNFPYVVMLAGAKSISSGGVGWVYFCEIFPVLLIKATGPYWFHYVSYLTRILICAACIIISFTMVGLSGSTSVQLVGVVFAGVQSGLGEASILGLTSFYNTRATITMWSSGTGLAGLFGYAWVLSFTDLFKLSFTATLLIANVSAVIYVVVFFFILEPKWRIYPTLGIAEQSVATARLSSLSRTENDTRFTRASEGERLAMTAKTASLNVKERVSFITTQLWPYMVPLFVVYFAEYCMQTGTWAAMGFPVSSSSSRETFYKWAGMSYQAGVFISRSSGLILQANMIILWAMPIMQSAFLVFFIFEAMYTFWNNYTIMIACFVTGLLGGGVYVNAFTLISKHIDPQFHEFSLSAASVADTIGIMMADITGVFLQCYLYKYHDIPGASVSC